MSKEISQYGSTVVDTPEQIWQVTSDWRQPVNMRSIIQLHWVPCAVATPPKKGKIYKKRDFEEKNEIGYLSNVCAKYPTPLWRIRERLVARNRPNDERESKPNAAIWKEYAAFVLSHRKTKTENNLRPLSKHLRKLPYLLEKATRFAHQTPADVIGIRISMRRFRVAGAVFRRAMVLIGGEVISQHRRMRHRLDDAIHEARIAQNDQSAHTDRPVRAQT
jgi:hypothetical protein